ncbi:phage baseplate assembly protein V [Desulfovibrio sp. OttesenSCG-928-G15]|nr:phage baseplate assembly protein V [Desulfovibrio sp. OttesenSCG-928-G15]
MSNKLLRTMGKQANKAAGAARTAYRAVLGTINPKPGVQQVQVDALDGESTPNVELCQHFGFTSAPPKGTECIIIPLGGKTTHSVIIGTEDANTRIVVAQGETRVYNADGAFIHLKNGRIIDVEADELNINVKNGCNIKCKDFGVKATNIKESASAHASYGAPDLDFGGEGGSTATARMNANIVQQGYLTSTGNHTAPDCISSGVSGKAHIHSGVESGGSTTDIPVQ